MRIVVLILITLHCSVAFAQSRTEKLSDGEIFVSTVAVKGASYPKLVIEAVIDAAPEVVFGVVSDCKNSHNVYDNLSSSKIIKRIGKDLVCAELVDLPWPIRNLESVTRWSFHPGPPVWKQAWTLAENAPDFDYIDGLWKITRFGDGEPQRAFVRYENHFSPQIFVPDWLTRAFLKVGAPGIIKDLRKACEAK